MCFDIYNSKNIAVRNENYAGYVQFVSFDFMVSYFVFASMFLRQSTVNISLPIGKLLCTRKQFILFYIDCGFLPVSLRS